MVEIIILDNLTKIKTNDLDIFIEGDFELKKEGAKAPTVSVIGYNQQLSEQLTEEAKNVQRLNH